MVFIMSVAIIRKRRPRTAAYTPVYLGGKHREAKLGFPAAGHRVSQRIDDLHAALTAEPINREAANVALRQSFRSAVINVKEGTLELDCALLRREPTPDADRLDAPCGDAELRRRPVPCLIACLDAEA
jgi:hypothetical protein